MKKREKSATRLDGPGIFVGAATKKNWSANCACKTSLHNSPRTRKKLNGVAVCVRNEKKII